LLYQIQEQAAQIKQLMSQLEATYQTPSLRRPPSFTFDSYASSPGPSSPVLSPSPTTLFHDSDAPAPNHDVDSAANKAVEDWITKTKQSFQEFAGLIGIGDVGMPKSYCVEEDLESLGSDDDDYVFVNGSDDGNGDYGLGGYKSSAGYSHSYHTQHRHSQIYQQQRRKSLDIHKALQRHNTGAFMFLPDGGRETEASDNDEEIEGDMDVDSVRDFGAEVRGRAAPPAAPVAAQPHR
jgi:hypothetical protein